MNKDARPLRDLDEWEEDLLRRYPDPSAAGDHQAGEAPVAEAIAAGGGGKQTGAFRDYGDSAPARVRDFYRLNHRYQTVDFVRQQRRKYLALEQRRMSVWEALEFLNTLVDESDPDTELSQIEHLLQTAEAIRADGHPRWFILTGLIHDLGKILCLFGEPQWAVVGDTFPVGCAFSDRVVFAEFFRENPDWNDSRYRSECGIYSPAGGLDQVLMSWGHDEYLYHVVRDHLPDEALYMIRYHSFYAAHREGAYRHLMDERDERLFRWVRAFNPYDLYTKSHRAPDVAGLRPYYQELIDEFFPQELCW